MRCVQLSSSLEDGLPVVLHADHLPAQSLCLGGGGLGGTGVGELALGVVMVDDQRKLGGAQHLDIDVRVAPGKSRQAAGLGEDVLGLAWADVQVSRGVLPKRMILPSLKLYSAAVPIMFSL